MFARTAIRNIAHWYSGASCRHRYRYQREKRYYPSNLLNAQAKIATSKKLQFKTNKWNYKQAYKDMP